MLPAIADEITEMISNSNEQKKRRKLSITKNNKIMENNENNISIGIEQNHDKSYIKEHKKKRSKFSLSPADGITAKTDSNTSSNEIEENQSENYVKEHKKKRSKFSITSTNDINIKNDNNITLIETDENQDGNLVKERKKKRSKLSITPTNSITVENSNCITSIEIEENQDESISKQSKKKRRRVTITPSNDITAENDNNTSLIETGRNQDESPVKEHRKKRNKLLITPTNGITMENDNNTTSIEIEGNQDENTNQQSKKKRHRLTITSINDITIENDNNSTSIEIEGNQDKSPVKEHKKKRSKFSITPINDITIENDNNITLIETEENQDGNPAKEHKKKRSKLSITSTNDINIENDNNITLIETEENQDGNLVKEHKKKRSKLSITPTNSITVENGNFITSIEIEENQDESISKQSKKKRRRVTITPSNDIIAENDNNTSLIEIERNQDENPVKEHKKKRSKLSIISTNDITIENEDKNSIEDKENENDISEIKVDEIKVKGLSGKYFRKAFVSSNGFDELKTFVTVCTENKKKDLASEYLSAGGNILEVLRLLDSSDKKNINKASTVFTAINILIMKILANFPQNLSSTEEACRHLINSHISFVHSMLSTKSSAKQRKVVLKLLTSIVSLGGSLPRELIAHLPVQPKVIEILVQHAKPSDSQNVRTCYIHFILSFLIEGNVTVIRSLLDKREVLTSIFPGLIFDKPEIINLLLASLKKYILENPGISKTLKLHLFSTPVVQNLISLYNWKGPTNWSKGKRSKNAATDVPAEEKEFVTDILHDFLITLLTSHRRGIIFHDRTIGTSREKHNQLISTVLQSLERPWEYAKPSDLIIKIMAACPSLIRLQLVYLESYLEPRVSKKWISIMTFIKQVIETIDMDACLKTCSSELNTIQLTNAIGSLCVSPLLIKAVIIPSLNHSSIIVRHEAMELLFSMINQMKKFLFATKLYNKNDIEVKSSVTSYIMKTVPNLNTILKVWTDAFVINKDTNNLSEDNCLSEPSKQKHFSTILNVLHMYNDICPELLTMILDVQPNLLFSGLNNLYDIDDEELIILKIRAIQFLLALDSSEFAPSKTTFTETFIFLSFLLNENSSMICSYAKATIKTLLNITGLFDGFHEQLDIWINGFCNVDNSEEKTELVNWLIKLIKTTIKHMDKYVNMIRIAEEIANDGTVNDNKLNNTVDKLHSIEDRKDNDKNVEKLYMQSATSISPILCCAISKLKANSTFILSQYISYVLIHTLHYQVNPEPLISLITDIQDLQGGKYLLSWCPGSNPTNIPKIFPSMNMMHKLSKALLKDSTIKLNELFTGDIKLTFNYENEEIIIKHTLSTYEIMIVLKMTIFYLTHDIRKNDFNEIKFNNYKRMIMCLLNIANTIQDEDSSTFVKSFIKTLFSHPIILQYFFFYQDKNTIEIMITNLILDICQIVMNVYNLPIIDLLTPYKNKAIIQIEKLANEKPHQCNSIYKTIITLLEQLQFTAEDIVQLFMILTRLTKTKFMLKGTSDLSMCGYIFPKLLQLLCNENIRTVHSEVSKLDIQFVKKAFSYMIFLKQQHISDVNLWETALQEYLHYFPHNIAAINTNTFKSILKQSIHSKNVQLISFLLSKNIKLLPLFIKYMLELENMKENTYLLSVIENNLKYVWKEDLIKKLSDSYKDEILHYILHPAESKNWIEENVNVICYIIENTFDLERCKDVCNTILQIGDQLEMVHICYIHILKSLYYKYALLEENRDIQIIMNFVQILFHIITLTLKKESKNIDKVILLCEKLSDTINYLKEKKNDFVFEDLSRSHSWSQFTRFSLKIGFTLTKDNKTYLPILKTLGMLCDVICKNDSNNEYAKTIFEMTISHSEFVNIMLTSSAIKRDVIQLLWILIQKNKSVMKSSHIPLYLAAYGATLSEMDQLILLILQYYERNNIKIHEYRPYLWGNAAAIHYSVKGDVSTALWRQPSSFEVLSLFEQEIVENTIKYYPVNRSLENSELHNAGGIYDPAFYLPLLCYLLSDNNIVACYKITQSGALALILIACSSNHSEVRMAAYTAIARYYFHLESSSFKEKVLWMRLIDSLRNGILSTENNLQDVHIISLVSTFLARTSIIATQPLHPLYLPLHNFLMVKPALDLNTVPELLQLFHSSDVNHKEHRHWILETIRDGIKTEKDVEVACKYMLYKMLLDFFTCLLSDAKTKKLILEVIESSTKIPKSCLLLIRGYGLLCWLTETVIRLKHCDVQWVTLIINIVSNILKTLLCVKKEYDFYRVMLLKILLSLKRHLTLEISICSFEQYLNLLQTLLVSNNLKDVISKEDMESIVDFSKNFIGEIYECENMLNHGCKFVNKAEHLGNMKENELEKTRKSMQALVWTWFKYGVR